MSKADFDPALGKLVDEERLREALVAAPVSLELSMRPMGRFELRLRGWAGRDWRWALWLLDVLERRWWKLASTPAVRWPRRR